jgi:hypothetical protein
MDKQKIINSIEYLKHPNPVQDAMEEYSVLKVFMHIKNTPKWVKQKFMRGHMYSRESVEQIVDFPSMMKNEKERDKQDFIKKLEDIIKNGFVEDLEMSFSCSEMGHIKPKEPRFEDFETEIQYETAFEKVYDAHSSLEKGFGYHDIVIGKKTTFIDDFIPAKDIRGQVLISYMGKKPNVKVIKDRKD